MAQIKVSVSDDKTKPKHIKYKWSLDGVVQEQASGSTYYFRKAPYVETEYELKVEISDGNLETEKIFCLVVLPPALKNVIFFIGDGMGEEHVEAAGLYAHGTGGRLSFEQFPYITKMTTASAGGGITDSAAAATAMATGVKVYNGVVSLRYPGSGAELCTMLEYFRDKGLKTGLVTTTTITHATPAGFGAHTSSRGNYQDIAYDYFTQTRPNLLLGGGANGITAQAEDNGYTVVMSAAGLINLDFTGIDYLSGQFGKGHLPYEYDGYSSPSDMPHLSQMTRKSLGFLSREDAGFFLMVEGGRIDHASHNSDITRTVHETLEFAKTVEIAVNWMGNRLDTLLIVTSDHETGGLSIVQNNGRGNYPTVSWQAFGSHTDMAINVYAFGCQADKIMDVTDNAHFFSIITGMYE